MSVVPSRPPPVAGAVAAAFSSAEVVSSAATLCPPPVSIAPADWVCVVTVTGVPRSVADAVATDEDRAVSGDVLANDRTAARAAKAVRRPRTAGTTRRTDAIHP